MVIKTQNLAGLAERYLIESIWAHKFPPGSELPAERELSQLIGVTRTTLREVLQRMARDGWLTIKHGKSTIVNNFWQTSGLNILETLVKLDNDRASQWIDNLLSVRTSIAAVFIRNALYRDPVKVKNILAKGKNKLSLPEDFTERDHAIFSHLAFASGNPVYGLILNGLKGLYIFMGYSYFANPRARQMAMRFYRRLLLFCTSKDYEKVTELVRHYGGECSLLWRSMCNSFSHKLVVK